MSTPTFPEPNVDPGRKITRPIDLTPAQRAAGWVLKSDHEGNVFPVRLRDQKRRDTAAPETKPEARARKKAERQRRRKGRMQR